MSPDVSRKDSTEKTSPKQPLPDTKEETEATKPLSYKGDIVTLDPTASIRIPAGWNASVSSNQSFLAIQVGRPGMIDKLAYDPAKKTNVDYNGIPSWNGLTEHFYIRKITTSSQGFQPSAHREVASEPFLFDDGTAGIKYSVTKHSDEAKLYGGLLKDTVWYGRVYVYQKENSLIEAHLAYYPSTKIDGAFFESVAKTIKST